MKTTIMSLVIASTTGLIYWSDERQAATQESEDKELRLLLEARRDTLATVVDYVKSMNDVGTLNSRELSKAYLALFDAELELAKNQPERIVILEKAVKVQAEAEVDVMRKLETGTVRKVDYVTAKAARIEAEIDLYRAKKGL